MTSKRSSGFTLLEIVVVLVIMAMVMAGAVAFKMSNSSEGKLKSASGKIEVLAKRARSIAVLHQTPYAIEFTPGYVKLMPFAEAVNEPVRSIRRDVAPIQADGARAPIHENVVVEDGLGLAVRRWGSDRWIAIHDRERQVWRFDPDGLCEPLEVRIVSGESWIENQFHPLTAAVKETAAEMK